MGLIGNYLSPYVRRVAVTLNILNIPFELENLFKLLAGFLLLMCIELRRVAEFRALGARPP